MMYLKHKILRERYNIYFIHFLQSLPDLKGRFPVHVVIQANHAQVASG